METFHYVPEGKPWKIGDPVTPLNATSESHVTGYIYDGEEWFLQYRWGGRDNECNERGKNCKRPQPKVYDADGVEIKVEDTVWSIKNGARFAVLNVTDGRLELAYFVDGIGYISTSWLNPDEVTHKEPDSLEKLQQFAVDSAAYAEGCEQDKFLEIADRLSALIERGA